MYWHIDTDIVSLIVICALYVYSLRSKRPDDGLYKRRSFLRCLRAGIVMTVVDIAASVIMEYPSGRFLYQLLMTLYLAVVQLVIVSWLLYSLTILYHDDPGGRKRAEMTALVPYAAYLALVLSNPWTGIFFTLGPKLEYARSSMFVPLVVGVYAAYALILLALMLLRRRHIPKEYPKSLLLMTPVILAVAIPVTLLNPGWLMMMPAYMLCLVLAFLFFQNVREKDEQKAIRQLEELVEHVSCGFAVSQISPEHGARVKYVNDGFFQICEADRNTMAERCAADPLSGAHPEDRERLRALLDDMERYHRGYETTYRFITDTGKVKRFSVRAQVVESPDGTATAYTTFTDITEETRLHSRFYDMIQNVPCGICLFEWDGEDLRPLVVNARYSEMLGEDAIKYLDGVKHMNYTHVHPEDLAQLRRKAYEGINGDGQMDATYRSWNDSVGKYIWVRLQGRKLKQPDGSSLVFVCYIDVTAEHEAEMQLREREKELWAKYELEKKRTSVDENDLLVHAVFNLTTGETLEYSYRDGKEVPLSNRDAVYYIRQNAGLLIDEEERRAFLALNDRDSLIERFERGESEMRMDYRRLLISGEVCWVRCTLHLVRDPRSGDILLFEYWYDIEEDKMSELMYQSIASDNYDFVARINGKSKRFIVIPKAGLSYHMPPVCGEDADVISLSGYNECVAPEDREMVVANTLTENILRNLREQGRFSFTYRELQPDGGVRYKKVTQYYIDQQREIIAMMREDVTDLIRSETEKNQILAAALDTANRASQAKSQFLSRVSHELRTPLNAIIGFMELAKGAPAAEVENYLQNSNAAAKQLLSIINDVLDMSSIESGKMKIAHTAFDFRHMLESVTNIYVSQCRQKGIDYETRILTPLDEWLVGDALRVNQILLNLLNNAVKFTDSGHVWLSVSQVDADSGRVVVRFEISDTGCGMSDEMRERLFRPFEQESATTAQKYGGNGLGLSIVGSLVGMMDGAIRVESSPGSGTVFSVDLPFSRSEDECVKAVLEGTETMRVLAVDDERSEREYVSAVLSRIGVAYRCVSGGSEALEELERGEKRGEPYNVALVDWRMPDMGGLETTRLIREKYGGDVVVIVVSAYEHNQAGESAKEAGADIFIPKPLFQSSLFDLFVRLTGGRIARTEIMTERPVLTGGRVLLAEDNAMNRMVAEGLIKKFGSECDCAVDGRKAVDAFLASPGGYYDAILMDIQMPEMDGFEATRAIRGSSHPDAGTVSIIALTANAFNENIAKALSCGMNAHVAKPIDPDKLAAALGRAYKSNA